jgi:enoyl-CoA hydratase
MRLGKPVLAAVEGFAVGGGFELALWCDLRVAASDAVFGIFNRRFGVPCVDGGTVRLPRLVGASRAMDLLLTGRAVLAEEAFAIGLANRLCPPGRALEVALALAHELAGFPQWGLPEEEALRGELRHGLRAIEAGEAGAGASRFAGGAGRHGAPTSPAR